MLLCKIPRAGRSGSHEKIFRESGHKERLGMVIQGTKVLCPHDAEEVERILGSVRRIFEEATNFPRLALVRGWKSFRLHRMTLTDTRRRCFMLGV